MDLFKTYKFRHWLCILLSCIPYGIQADINYSWNGFATFGFSQIDDETVLSQGNIPYSTHTEKIDEQLDTKIALQGSIQFNQQVGATIQLLSKANVDYSVEPVWAYLSYQFNDQMQFRLGRLRRSLFSYSDYYDVGYAYSWARPPTTTYFEFGPFYNPIDSVDFFYQKAYSNWNFSAQSYYGTDSGKGEIFFQTLTYEESNAYGVSFELENESMAVRLGYHLSKFTIDIPGINQVQTGLTQLGFGELGDGISIKNKLAEFLSFGASFTQHNWRFSAESTRMTPRDSILPTVKAWYASVSRSFGAFSMHYTYGQQKSRNKKDAVTPILNASTQLLSEPSAIAQFSGATLGTIATNLAEIVDTNESDRHTNIFGIRYELFDSTALKFEYERVKNLDSGSAGDIFSVNVDVIF